jgi:iron complex transport system substrate-binding protein
MKKICSFLPAATSMIYEMGLENELAGVTFECPSDKPKVVRSYLEGTNHSSKEIDQIVSQSKAQGKSLYYIDDALLASIAPDIIFTQDVCDVCQIDTSHVARSVYKLEKEPELIPLIPRNLDDIYENAITIAKAFGREERAYELLAGLKKRTDFILNTLRENNAPLKRVMVMEWLDPIYNCGHWIPYQIAQAGGVDMLSNPSGYSIVTSWERILQYNPEVLVVAPCGFEVHRSGQEIESLSKLEGWENLKAVQNNAVFLADADLFTQPSTTVVDGIELLAALFHPTLFEIPKKLEHKYLSFHTAEKVK